VSLIKDQEEREEIRKLKDVEDVVYLENTPERYLGERE
jgi:hypothetical protein